MSTFLQRKETEAMSEPVQILEITPPLAAEWLEQNTHNRNLRQPFVMQLASAIARGEWLMNGESIKFDANGTLIDGQHRLAAIVKANVPVRSVVVFGLASETQATVDTGAKRSFADVLRLEGAKNNTTTASAVSTLYRFYTGAFSSSHTAATAPTHIQLLELWRSSPGLDKSIRVGEHLRQTAPELSCPGGPFAALHYLLSGLSPDDANVFFERLSSGNLLTTTDPVFKLRRWLADRQAERTVTVTRVKLAYAIKAWNYWIAGAEPKILVWRPGGANKEQFPTPETPERAAA